MSYIHPFLASSVFSPWGGESYCLQSRLVSWLQGLAVLSQSQCLRLFAIKRESVCIPQRYPCFGTRLLGIMPQVPSFLPFHSGELADIAWTKACPAASTARCSGKRDLQRCLSPSPCTHQRGTHLSLVRPGCQLWCPVDKHLWLVIAPLRLGPDVLVVFLEPKWIVVRSGLPLACWGCGR